MRNTLTSTLWICLIAIFLTSCGSRKLGTTNQSIPQPTLSTGTNFPTPEIPVDGESAISIDENQVLDSDSDSLFSVIYNSLSDMLQDDGTTRAITLLSTLLARVISERVHSGIVEVNIPRGEAHSNKLLVPVPPDCLRPIPVLQSLRDSIKCGSPSAVTRCNNDPGTTSTDLKAMTGVIQPGVGFTVFASAANTTHGVDTTAVGIAYHFTCQPS